MVVDGQELFRVRGFSGYPAAERARLIGERIEAAAVDASVPASVRPAASAEGLRLAAGDRVLMVVVDGDARVEDLKLETLAGALAVRIEQAMRSYREARSPGVLLRAAEQAAVATLLLLVALVLGRVGLRPARPAHRARVRGADPLRADPVVRGGAGAAPARRAARRRRASSASA